jgi:glycosyltransferase involved in cell wall biosynthesis
MQPSERAAEPGRPLVSIITPTRNQADFIEDTIRSIRGQSYGFYEHIVIDGGSTDGTLDILRGQEGAYPMRWLSEPDAGMYDAVNKGLRLATGEILCYLNSDDLFFPWTLATVVAAFNAHPDTSVVYGDALGLRADGLEEIRFAAPGGYAALQYATSLIQPAVFWRRAIYDTIGGFDPSMRLAGDLDYWLRMGADCQRQRVDEILAVDRDHASNKRAQQWSDLMAESRSARLRSGARAGSWHRLRRTTERLRAWAQKRRLWIAFLRAARVRGSERWGGFLGASRPRLDARAVVLGQLPWLGNRLSGGAIECRVDWSAGEPRPRGPRV